MVGLTGGIASGKTTISGIFAELGALILNADLLGREVVAPGEPALAELVRALGPGILLPDGSLDRAGTAARVFSDPAALRVLNRTTHPRIAERLEGRLRDLARAGIPRVVVVEAAVLFEAGWEDRCDRVVVVVTQPSVQVARLTRGLGLTPAEASARVAAQLPVEERVRRADYLVSGQGPLNETRSQVERIWADLGSIGRSSG